ncbi:hypothetical protein NL676_004151 [Syzygium grande]|nr:hypothetical protein NL676_004151 [Syzygium grande]
MRGWGCGRGDRARGGHRRGCGGGGGACGAVRFRGVVVVLAVGTIPATGGAAGVWTSHLRLRRRTRFGAAA